MVCQRAFGLLEIRFQRPWFRILHSAEEDNYSPSESISFPCCQCIKISTNKHVSVLMYVIIFNKGGHRITRHNFTLNDACLEIVQHYTYLGILFSSIGSFNQACKALYDKALKSFFKLKQLNPRNNVVMAMKLFDMLVTPILIYGSNIWAPTLVKKI